MTLTDAGPLVALINRNDLDHRRCTQYVFSLEDSRLVTTLPCVTEAMHLLFRRGGAARQMDLWKMIDDGRVLILLTSDADLHRMRDLMAKYADLPMDFADASLVVAAENLITKRIFSLDTDFHIYRMADGSAFDVFPK